MASIAGKWTKIASSKRLQRSSQCLSVINSQAWIFGGEVQPREPVDSQFDVVEPESSSSDQATTKTIPAPQSAPIPRVGATTTSLFSKIHPFSGRGGLSMASIEEHGSLWTYTTNTWSQITPSDPSAPYPAGRSYHAMTSDSTQNVYIHAGCPEKGRLDDLWRFDTSARTWTQLPSAPAPPRGGPSIAFLKGKIYRMNGFDGAREQGGAIDVFDTATSKWDTISFVADGVYGPEARSVSALLAVCVRGRDMLVTLFGERDPSSLGHAGAGKMLGDVWGFDLQGGSWAKVETEGEGPAPRGWFDAGVGAEGQIVVHGGLAEDNSRLGNGWRLEWV